MRVPLPLIGPAYQNRSLPVSAQTTVNLYPEVNQEGKTLVSLHAFPGLKEFTDLRGPFSDNPVGIDRGLLVVNKELFAVTGNKLYGVGPTGQISALSGFGANDGPNDLAGSDRVDMASNGTIIVMATGEGLYMSDVVSLSRQKPDRITDADVIAPSTVAYLNGQFIFDDSEGTEFKTSQVTGALTITDFADGVDVASAEAHPDPILRVVSFNQMVYFHGSESMEPWYNSGIGNPPFDRVNSGIRKIGIAGRWAIAVDDDAIFFLDDTRTPRMMRGFDTIPLGTPPLGKEFQGYSTVEDAVALVYTIDAQRFFQLNFPTANKSWVYHEPSASWFQLSSGVDGRAHASSSYAYVYGKHIFAHPTNGKLYELDFDTFTDAGETVQRKRTTANIHGGLYGAPGAELIFDRVIFDIETGVGLETGQGSAPKVMIRYSDDAGRTWSAEDWYSLGVGGDYRHTVELTQQGRAYNRVYELTYSDPTRFSLLGASADVSMVV